MLLTLMLADRQTNEVPGLMTLLLLWRTVHLGTRVSVVTPVLPFVAVLSCCIMLNCPRLNRLYFRPWVTRSSTLLAIRLGNVSLAFAMAHLWLVSSCLRLSDRVPSLEKTLLVLMLDTLVLI